MTTTRSSRRSRTAAAIGLVLGGVCLLLSSIVSPAWADGTAAYLDEVAAGTGRHVASAIFLLAAGVLMFPGLVSTIRLLRGPRGLVGQIGASLLAMGTLAGGGLVLAINAVEVAMVDPKADRAQMVALAERGEESTGAMIGFLGVWVLGLIGGIVLLAVGLWLRRAVPAWAPVLLLLPIALLPFSEGRTVSGVGMGFLVLGLAAVGIKLASLEDEEWERPEPLGSRARPSGHVVRGPSPA